MNRLFISETDSLTTALEVIDSGGKRIALVVDDAGKLLGTLADGDVRRHLLSGGGIDDLVEVVYHREPLTTESETLTAELRREMERRGITCVPVLKEGKPVSLLTLSDAEATDLPAILGGKPLFIEPLPVARPTLPPFEELEDDLRRAIESGMITNGPLVAAFEAATAKYIGVSPEQVIAVSSCTIGLTLALRTVATEGEVIMPSFTYFATGLAATWNRLTPVLVEANPDDFNIDVEATRRAITPKTRAIMGVYIFGSPPPIKELRALADEAGIPLFLDAAHALGTRLGGKSAGSFGDVEVFSLSPTKPVTAGEGGLVVCRDPERASQIRLLRNLGILDSASDTTHGLNSRMSELNAALGRASLAHNEANLARRHELVALYKSELAGLAGLDFQHIAPENRTTYKDFAIVVDEKKLGISRDALAEGLRAENIATKRYFNPPLHLQRRFDGLARQAGALPVTEKLSNSILCLPLYSHQEPETISQVATAIRRLVAHGGQVSEKLAQLHREWM